MNAVAMYDFNLPVGDITKDQMVEWMNAWGKKWVFQTERGDTGYMHYQCKISLKKKRRLHELVKAWGEKIFPKRRLSPTVKGNMDDWSYVDKEDTRVEGPWSSDDEVVYIPRQIREIAVLKPWQQTIIADIGVWNKRTINVVYCEKGGVGKSTLIGYIRAHKLGMPLPLVKSYQDMMRMVCNLPTSGFYTVDMPRGIKKENLGNFWAGLETIKDGYAYDDRYTFKQKVFDCPNIWVFTNNMPDLSLLSRDRWVIWVVQDDELKEWKRPGANKRMRLV